MTTDTALVCTTVHLFYEGSGFVPVRNSHVYIDLPTDDQGFLRGRTDVNGRLLNVEQERPGARGAGPMQIPLERDAPFRVFCDDGVMDPQDFEDLPKYAATCTLKEREVGGRKQAYFEVPKKDFNLRVDVVEVNVFAGWVNPEMDPQTGVLAQHARGEPRRVLPLQPSPVAYRTFPRSKVKNEPPRKPPKNLHVTQVWFRGLAPDEPAFRIDPRLDLGIEPDFVERVFARAILEEVWANGRMSLDDEAHAYIKRSYPRIELSLDEWAKRAQRNPASSMVEATERGPGVWEAYARRPPGRWGFEWQRDFLDRLWIELARDPTQRVTPELEVESWVGRGERKRKRRLIDVLVHNRQVLLLDSLIALAASSLGAGIVAAILERNVDQGVQKWLPAMRGSCDPVTRLSTRFLLYAQALWPRHERIAALVWPADARGLADTRAYLAATEREAEAAFAPTEAEVEAQLRLVGGMPEARMRAQADALFNALVGQVRGLARLAQEACERWGRGHHGALLARDAARPATPDLVHRVRLGHAALAHLRCGVARMRRLVADLAGAANQGWVAALTNRPNGLAVLASANRDDLRELLEGWEAERLHLHEVAVKRLAETSELWKQADERAKAAMQRAAALAQAATTLLGPPAAVPGAAFVEALAQVDGAVDDLRAQVAAAASALCCGDKAGRGEVQPEEGAADALWALAQSRVEEMREVWRLAQYDR